MRLPFVVITTQAWPEEWWRAPRNGAVQTAPSTAAQRAISVATIARPVETAPVITVAPMPAPTDMRQASHGPRDRPHGAEPTDRLPGRRRRSRGTFTRLAMLGLGLLVSIVAVEAASRRRG